MSIAHRDLLFLKLLFAAVVVFGFVFVHVLLFVFYFMCLHVVVAGFPFCLCISGFSWLFMMFLVFLFISWFSCLFILGQDFILGSAGV